MAQIRSSTKPSDPDEATTRGVGDEVNRTPSTRERWLEAGWAAREKAALFAARLGRPPSDEIHGLDFSGIHPEQLGATDDIQLAARSGNNAQEEPYQSKYEAALSLIQGLDFRQHEGLQNRKPHVNDSDVLPDTGIPASRVQRDVEFGNSPPTFDGGGVLSHLLRLHASQSKNSRPGSVYSDDSDHVSAFKSGTATPSPELPHPPGTTTPVKTKDRRKWYKNPSHTSTAALVQTSMNLGRMSLPASANLAPIDRKSQKRNRRMKRKEEEVKLTIHISEIIVRQRYLMQLCRAFMRYGAPTHRLEEYMQMTARVLDVEAQFMYLPGCMLMSFDDSYTRTAEVKLIRVVQGLDLGRLGEVHDHYKRVAHDMMDIQSATNDLTELMGRKPRYPKWALILLYGLGSAAVGPFAFSARPIDMPIIFLLGCCVGFMQHVLAPISPLYSNVFEVTAAILVSFLARAFGSITLPGHSDPLFCYSSIAESSIALILPGFGVLTSSLELQSHQIIAGSIRLVYTIIYSLFLGYGVTVGTTIYGALDSNATRRTSCLDENVWGSAYASHFPFVALYCFIAAIINQAKLKHTPMMVLIGTSGYVANYFSTQKLGSSSEVANTVGAFTIGLLANLYSRLWHGNAVTVTIPGIFCLVPSGLASSGSIMSAIEYSDAVKNGTADTSGGSSGSSLTSLGYGMIETAIGITVGLFISALIVYPYGKRRSGLFSF
ncbi:hypothetical protein O988_06948 [Pseudogymnoascus sp. VKM F-3808]|nr:hypothetical protein O988_06948 [Pseudogymnoascus sp. VKM F-3808]